MTTAQAELAIEAGAAPADEPAAENPAWARQGQELAQPDAGERVFVLDADLGDVTLSLGYIVFKPSDPFAEINGREVRQGSLVEGYRVEEIERDRVRLRQGERTVVLRVR
jgi:hypothetical protein